MLRCTITTPELYHKTIENYLAKEKNSLYLSSVFQCVKNVPRKGVEYNLFFSFVGSGGKLFMCKVKKYALMAAAGPFGSIFACTADSLNEINTEFTDWVTEMKLTSKKLWYADIFDTEKQTHIGLFKLDSKGIIFFHAPKDSKVDPSHPQINCFRKFMVKINEMIGLVCFLICRSDNG